MWRCPVCSNQQNSNPTVCRACGFDGSNDVEFYPTLMRLNIMKRNSVQGIIQERISNQKRSDITLAEKVTELERRVEQLEIQLSLIAKGKVETAVIADKKEVAPKRILKNALGRGAIIEFGMYPQGENRKRSPIEWIVLDIADGKALLISKYTLELMQYHNHDEEITWETCDIRKWLNGEFLNIAFTKEESGWIVNQRIRTLPNQKYSNSNVGIPTFDRIFLLDCEEIQKYFLSKHRAFIEEAELTNKEKAYRSNNVNWWWTRTPGLNNRRVAIVNEKGELSLVGCEASFYKLYVRPALWVRVEK